MDSSVARILVVVAVLVVAGVVALLSRRSRSYHPPVTVAGLDFAPGIVVFTSVDCARCREVLEVVKAFDVPLREVTYELEGDLQRRAGVVGVPLTLVIAQSGLLAAQIPGRVKRRDVARAIDRAGL